MQNLFLYLMSALYAAAGVAHLVRPTMYLFVMPKWMPAPIAMIYASGVLEIVLAAMLLPIATRAVAAWLIIGMLIVYFFVNHLSQSIHFYQTGHRLLFASVVRLVAQFGLLAWAWIYTR